MQLSKIEDNDEKQMATGIIKASDLRKEYCEARIVLEEAKILDKKGDHFASSREIWLSSRGIREDKSDFGVRARAEENSNS